MGGSDVDSYEGGDPDEWYRVERAALPWVAELRLLETDRGPRLIGLRLEPKAGAPIKDLTLDGRRWRKLWQVITAMKLEARALTSDPFGGLSLQRLRDEKPPGQRAWPDSHFERVAEAYRAALAAGRAPRPVIQRIWSDENANPISMPTVDLWIRAARDKGYLEEQGDEQ